MVGVTKTCTNQNGTYFCTCDVGYALNGDGHTCDGETIIYDMYYVRLRAFLNQMC